MRQLLLRQLLLRPQQLHKVHQIENVFLSAVPRREKHGRRPKHTKKRAHREHKEKNKKESNIKSAPTPSEDIEDDVIIVSQTELKDRKPNESDDDGSNEGLFGGTLIVTLSIRNL
jgi:hypothetical protein